MSRTDVGRTGESRTRTEFASELIDAGHAIPTGTPGVVGRSRGFEEVVNGLSAGVRARLEDNAPVEFLSFPPVSPQAVFERTDYVTSFPQLIGSVRVFTGGAHEHKVLLAQREREEDWTGQLSQSELMLTAAACHPLYGVLAGSTIHQPRRVDLIGQCFRHEPSDDPARLVSFRMHEQVIVADAHKALAHRDLWLDKFVDLLGEVGLQTEVEVANDPFFGRAGKMLAAGQREEALKFEVMAPICGDTATAIASVNAHQDHFGVNFAISLPDETPAHSACAGLGLERTALALLSRHGMDIDAWPSDVLTALSR